MPQEDPRVLELRELRAKASQGGGEDRIAKQHAKGKLTARERINLLLDPGTFNEIEQYVTAREPGVEKTATDGVVTGFGQIAGRTVYVYAQDFTVLGGALGEMQGRKICRVLDLAVKSGVPVVGMIDSGGARIQEGIYSLVGYAEIFRRNAQYSGIVPQISLMMGPCAGGAAYSPALTDLIIMVQGNAFMFLTGPEVVKTVTGEEIDTEGLGGASVHAHISGTAHLEATNDKEAIEMARTLLSYLPANSLENPPHVPTADPATRMDEELNSIVPLDWNAPYSMHEVIERVVDQGSFYELFAGFAQNAVIGFARLNGFPVGIVANEPMMMAGAIDMNAADKIARFVRLCDCYNLPIVTFVDTPGFLPGTQQEHGGVIRHGAKVLYAYAEAGVPRVSIITRKAYGGAYIVMGSKPMGNDYSVAWPSAEIAVMGPEGAVNIVYRKQIDSAEDKAAERVRLVDEYRKKYLNPYVAASAGYLDDVIEPRETRMKLIAALAALREKYAPPPARKHGNIPV